MLRQQIACGSDQCGLAKQSKAAIRSQQPQETLESTSEVVRFIMTGLIWLVCFLMASSQLV